MKCSSYDTHRLADTVINMGFIYDIMNEHVPWWTAEKRCVSMHAHLTSILSVEENNFLKRFAGWEYSCGVT